MDRSLIHLSAERADTASIAQPDDLHGTGDAHLDGGRPTFGYPAEEPPALAISTRGDASRPVVELRGEIDLATCGQLREALDRLVADGTAVIDLDMAGVGFIDSSGLTVMMRLTKDGVSLRMVGLSPPARRAIELAGLSEHFHLAQ
jgi:anti-sigma B factor antagonist